MSLINCYCTGDTAIRTTRLEPCDVILWINEKNDPINRLSRWAIGQYSHVAMYLGRCALTTGPDHTVWNVPLVYESRGRGVYIASLLPQTGAMVRVMRLKSLDDPMMPKGVAEATVRLLLASAFALAAEEKHFYDYFAIVHSVIPRVIAEKLRLPLPLKYHRDIFMICSEAVAEVWWRTDTMILPDDKMEFGEISAGSIPLPGDFAKSPILEFVRDGKLMEDIVP